MNKIQNFSNVSYWNSYRSALQFFVEPGSKEGNNYACGNLVNINGKIMASTNANVLRDTHNNKIRDNIRMKLIDHPLNLNIHVKKLYFPSEN